MRGAALKRRTVRRSPSALRPQMRGAAPVVAVPRVETLIGRELAGLHETARYRFQHDEDPHPSEILRKRSKPGQKLGDLWDHVLESNAALSGLWSKRWKAWLGLPRYILPYDETPAAKETAEFCRLALERVPKLHINLQHQATGMTHGWAADDLVVELLEAKRGGDVTYEKFLAIGNHAKALLFLGEGDTSGFESGQGSFARRRVSNEVRLETIRIDAREFDAHMTDNLLSLLVAVNFGPAAPVPRWYTEVEDAEDLRMRQERADAVLDRGLPLPLEDYYRINRQRMPRAGESVILRPGADGVEVIDPPEGFDFTSNAADPAARPPDDESPGYEGAPRERGLSPDESGGHLQTRLLPFNTPTERRALRRYRAGDIHDYQLAA